MSITYLFLSIDRIFAKDVFEEIYERSLIKKS